MMGYLGQTLIGFEVSRFQVDMFTAMIPYLAWPYSSQFKLVSNDLLLSKGVEGFGLLQSWRNQCLQGH
jgi:hypothetical protein